MDNMILTAQDVLDAAAGLFNTVEDADIRDGVVRLAARLLIPDAADSGNEEISEALTLAAIEGVR